MKRQRFLISAAALLCMNLSFAQVKLAPNEKLDPVVLYFVNEVNTQSQVETMAKELLDDIGPRLVGTPEMEMANDYTVKKLQSWGIEASKEAYGTWRGWQRGITHVDMTYPRVKTLNAIQLAWSPATRKPVEAEVVVLPKVNSKAAFEAWLPSVKGKVVLISQNHSIGRPDYQLKEFATPELYEKLKKQKEEEDNAFKEYFKTIGYNSSSLAKALEKAGAAAVGTCTWTGIMGADRIFGAKTDKIPMFDVEQEDYGLLYRLAENGKKPKIRIQAESKTLPVAKTFNTVGIIKGKEKPDEYVILSAHLDSWDGAQGATDNGTGTLTMLEAMRLLKKYYPDNKRSIVIGLWCGEEQGLNGSRAFVKDHPEIIKGTQAAFNQDNGTGRVVNISGQGFVNAYDFIGRWLKAAPKQIKDQIETSFPGMPSGGGSDHASFTAAGVPGIGLSSLNWGYFGYTWHTTKDTYDKIVFDEVKSNAVLTATLAYMASEDPELASREKRVMPENNKGETIKWPEAKDAARNSDDSFK